MRETGLSAELRRRAEEAAEEILRAAEGDAERIKVEAQRAVGVREREVLEEREQSYRAQTRVHLAAARHEAMRVVLLARTRLVQRVLDRAKALLPEALHSEAYASLLSREVEEALEFIDDQSVVIQCPTALEPVVREKLVSSSSATIDTESEPGMGFIAIGRGGDVRVDGTLETRLVRLAPLLAIEIQQRLRSR